MCHRPKLVCPIPSQLHLFLTVKPPGMWARPSLVSETLLRYSDVLHAPRPRGRALRPPPRARAWASSAPAATSTRAGAAGRGRPKSRQLDGFAALGLPSPAIVKSDLTDEQLGTRILDGKNSIKDLDLKLDKERLQSMNSNCMPSSSPRLRPCRSACRRRNHPSRRPKRRTFRHQRDSSSCGSPSLLPCHACSRGCT
jgi:hypothetical protein